MINGVLPANSAVMNEFGVSYALVQWTLTIFMLATLIAQPILGYWADQWGRRPIMILGLCLFAVGCFVSATATSINVLLLGRFLQGFGGAVCTFLPRTIVRDLYPQDRAASMIGYMTMAMMTAPLFGPAFGGWITDTFDWRYLYGILGVIGFLVAFFAWRSLVETAKATHIERKVSFFQAAKTLLAIAEFRAFAFLTAGSIGVYYAFLGSAPYLIMEQGGVSASLFGRFFIVVAIGYLSGNTVAALLSEKVGALGMIRLGHIPLVLGIVGFWLSLGFDSPLAIYFPMMFIAFSNGMSLPNLTSGAMSVHEPLAASASGIIGALQTAVGILMTVLLGVLLPHSAIWFQIMVTLSVGCGLSAWYSNGRRSER